MEALYVLVQQDILGDGVKKHHVQTTHVFTMVYVLWQAVTSPAVALRDILETHVK